MEPDEMISVPSGRPVWFLDVLSGALGDGLTYRFRFVAPDLGAMGQVLDPVKTEADMAHLCKDYAMKRVPNVGPQPNRIVISMADRATEFGVASPDVTQVFESYSMDNGNCVWEAF